LYRHGQPATMQDNTGCSIFIGNIPYTATEDQLQVRSQPPHRRSQPSALAPADDVLVPVQR
jgi:hypothetical protein